MIDEDTVIKLSIAGVGLALGFVAIKSLLEYRSAPVVDVTEPSVTSSYVQDVLCGSHGVIEALQPEHQDGARHSVTIASYAAHSIGDRGLVCNVHAVLSREPRGASVRETHQVDRIFLVAVTGEVEQIDKQFADSLLASRVMKTITKN